MRTQVSAASIAHAEFLDQGGITHPTLSLGKWRRAEGGPARYDPNNKRHRQAMPGGEKAIEGVFRAGAPYVMTYLLRVWYPRYKVCPPNPVFFLKSFFFFFFSRPKVCANPR